MGFGLFNAADKSSDESVTGFVVCVKQREWKVRTCPTDAGHLP